MINLRTGIATLASIAAAAALAAPAFAQSGRSMKRLAQPMPVERVVSGTLNCDVAGGIGLILGSSKALSCVFTPANGGPQIAYLGGMTRVGVDIGFTGAGKLSWAVSANTSMPLEEALAGSYGGPSASFATGVGFGATMLVGGSNRTVSLQPLAGNAQTGLDVAAGITTITLQSLDMPKVR